MVLAANPAVWQEAMTSPLAVRDRHARRHEMPGDLQLSKVLECPVCGTALRFDRSGLRNCCDRPRGSAMDGLLLQYEPTVVESPTAEARARDRQARGYLSHGKFPTQLYRMRQFIHSLPAPSELPVLDLGCGPGPTTALLLQAGHSVVAVDFSAESLRANASHCGPVMDRALFVHADLRTLRFISKRASGLMMSDFLAQLGDQSIQRDFLARAFEALVPGGWFFLSVVNTNLKNLIRRDLVGSFSDGAIVYHRLTARKVVNMIPEDIVVESITPMNIFHGVALDRLAANLPFAKLFARWILVCGRKRQ